MIYINIKLKILETCQMIKDHKKVQNKHLIWFNKIHNKINKQYYKLVYNVFKILVPKYNIISKQAVNICIYILF